MSRLQITDLVVDYGGGPVLRGVDLTVPEGSLVAVLGPSGCGKTSLLRAVAGFLRPAAGTIRLGDRTVAGPGAWVPPEERLIGIVPQEGALFPHLDVAGNVGFGLTRADRRSSHRIDELLALVGLPGTGQLRPHELSGGMQQRVAVARALAPRPTVVLLDEPFSALDTALRAAVRADVRAALLGDGATAVLVTHDQEEALSTADLVAVVRDGQVVQAGTPDEVYNRPADLQVGKFIGESVLLAATADGDTADSVLGRLPVIGSGSGAGRLLVRPEQFALTDDTAGRPATVTTTTYHGHDALIGLRLPDGTAVTVRTLGTPSVRAGDTVGVTVSGTACFFADAAE